MNRLAGLTFGLALGLGMVGQGPAQAGPFTHAAELRAETGLPVQDVSSRQARRNRALAAGAIIGGAIVGGAILAESQRRRDYYVDDGYYQDRRYNNSYYAPAQYYRGPQQPLPPAYFNQGGEAGRPPADFYAPSPRYYQPAPRYYGPGPGYYGDTDYYETPRRRGRTVRDPAGGGVIR